MKSRDNITSTNIDDLENRINIIRKKISQIEKNQKTLRTVVITNIRKSDNIENRMKNLNRNLHACIR